MADNKGVADNPVAPEQPKQDAGKKRVDEALKQVDPKKQEVDQTPDANALAFGFGRLNPIQVPQIRRTLDRDDTSIFGLMREAGLKQCEVDTLKNTGPYLGVVLRVDTPTDGKQDIVTGFFGALADLVMGPATPPTFKVRIPELHACLPAPKDFEDQNIIGMYPTFHVQGEGMALEGFPEIGQLVWCDYQNRTNRTKPYIVRPYKATNPINTPGQDVGNPPGFAGGLPPGAKSKFTFGKVCPKGGELATFPPKGDPLPGKNASFPSKETGDAAKPREDDSNTGFMRKAKNLGAGAATQLSWITDTYSKAHPRTIKLWSDEASSQGLRGKIWIGKFKDNGEADSLERESSCRETIIFAPEGINFSLPIEIIYYFHDLHGFDREEFSKRIIPALIKMGAEKRNYIFVYHELMWSKGDTGKSTKRSENTKGIFKNTKVGGNFGNLHNSVLEAISKTLGKIDPTIGEYIYSFVAAGMGGLALKNIAEQGHFTSIVPTYITMASADFASKYTQDVTLLNDHNYSWTSKVWKKVKNLHCEFNILCVGKEEYAPAELYPRLSTKEVPISFAPASDLDTEVKFLKSVDKFRPTANSLRFLYDVYTYPHGAPKLAATYQVSNPLIGTEFPPGGGSSNVVEHRGVNKKVTVTYAGLNNTHEQVCDNALFWRNGKHVNKFKFQKPVHMSPSTPKKSAYKGGAGGALADVDMSEAEMAKMKKAEANAAKNGSNSNVVANMCNQTGAGTGDFGRTDPTDRKYRYLATKIKNGYAKPFKTANTENGKALTGEKKIVWSTFHKRHGRKKAGGSGLLIGGKINPQSAYNHWMNKDKYGGINGIVGKKAAELLPANSSFAAQHLTALHHAAMDQMGRMYSLAAGGWKGGAQYGAIDCSGLVSTVRMLTFMMLFGTEGGPIKGTQIKSGNGFLQWYRSKIIGHFANCVSIYRNPKKYGYTPVKPLSGPGKATRKAPEFYLGTPNIGGGMGTNMWSERNLMPGDILWSARQPFTPPPGTKKSKSKAIKQYSTGHIGFNRPGYAPNRPEPSFGHVMIAFANADDNGNMYVCESGGPFGGTGIMPLPLFLSFRQATCLFVYQPKEMAMVWETLKPLTKTATGRPDGEWTSSLYRRIMNYKSAAVPIMPDGIVI